MRWWNAWLQWVTGIGMLGSAVAWAPVPGSAHPAYLTAATLTVERDGTFHGQVRFDTLAFVLNDTSTRIGNAPMEELLAEPTEVLAAQLAGAQERFMHGFGVVTDAGSGAVESADFPEVRQISAWRDEMRPVLPVVLPIQVAGRVPPGTHTVAFRFPSVLEQVILTVERPDEEPVAEAVEAGKASTPLSVRIGTVESVGQLNRHNRGTAFVDEGRLKASARSFASFGVKSVWIVEPVLFLAGIGACYRWCRHRGKHGPRF